MTNLDNWTIKKAECWRTDAFKLWCWRRLLRVLWTAKKSNQSILKEINPKYFFIERTDVEAEAPVLGYLMQRADSLEKTLMLGKIEGRRRGWQRIRWLDGINGCHWMTQWTWIIANFRWLRTGKPVVLWFMGLAKSQTQVSDQTTNHTTILIILIKAKQTYSKVHKVI